jgi:hypothetical protein
VTCQDLLAYLLILASKQASHEASFFPSKQVVEALLACLLVGLVGWRFRRRIARSTAKIANNKVHRYVAPATIAPIVGTMYKKKFVSAVFCSIIKDYISERE